MSSYIGKVQIGEGTPVLVGSTLYGVCDRDADVAAKTVTSQDTQRTDLINTNYDQLLVGTTIHVKFIKGNSVTSNLTLQVGTLVTAQNIVGDCTCPAGTIISFTLDENQNWIANDNVDTNTEYVFKTQYNASTNRVLGEADVGAAAEKGVITDIANNSTSTDLPTTAAVASYVQSLTGGLAGLTGAMHFRGITSTAITDGGTENPTIDDTVMTTKTAGDVVLYNAQEYVWTGSAWELLGDEGSYVLATSQTTGNIGSASGWNAGSASSATVVAGVLQITNSVAPSLTVTSTNVVVPVTTP